MSDQRREVPCRLGLGSPKIQHALSVDVEEWFHAAALEAAVRKLPYEAWESRVVPWTVRLLDLFDEVDAKATFFVLGWVAERHPDLVRAIERRGHEVASHGYSHTPLTRQTPAEFCSELTRALRICEDLTGQRVLGHRAPTFSLTKATSWAFDILLALGVQYDSSLRGGPGNGVSRPYWIALPSGGRIREYPVAALRISGYCLPVGGGGYFRLYPYSLTRYLLRCFEMRGVSANVFLHPWELDVDHPDITGIGRMSHFRHYVNLRTVEPKLRRLLKDFRFCPIRDILNLAAVGCLPAELKRGPVAQAGMSLGGSRDDTGPKRSFADAPVPKERDRGTQP